MKTEMKTISLSILIAATLMWFDQTAHAQSGGVDTTFMPRVGPDGAVNAVVAQPDDLVVLGGAFTHVNFTPLNRLARADTNGNVDATFAIGSGADAAVNALALQGDGKLLVGGAFTNFNGMAHPGLVRLNGNGSVDGGFVTGAGADGPVNFVAWQTNGQVLIQGAFSNYNGTPRLGLARLNANGSLDPAFDPGSRATNVTAIAWQADGKVVFSGSLTNLDGITATNLARLNADGSLDSNFCAAASLDAAALSLVLQPDGRMLVSGGFTRVNGVVRWSVARLSADGTLDMSFDPGTGFRRPGNRLPLPGLVYLALQPDSVILAWGNFTSFDGTNRDGAARLTSTGSLDSAFNPAWGASQSYVKTVACLADGRFITGGRSAFFGYLAWRTPDGIRDEWMNETGPNDSVYSVLVQPDGRTVAAGSFNSVNGTSRNCLVRFTEDGSLDPTFQIGTGFLGSTSLYSQPWLWTLARQPDGKLLAGGSFTTYNGTSRTNLARLNADGSLDPSFAPGSGPDGEVDALAVQPDGRILVGGYFNNVNGLPHPHLARLNPDGSVDETFRASDNPDYYSIWAIALQPDGRVIVGGDFEHCGETSRPNLARFNPDGTLDNTFQPSSGGPDGVVYALAIQPDGRILIGGDFSTVNGVNREHLARLNPDGSLDATFAPVDFNQDVYSILLQTDGKVVVGGRFYSYDTNGIVSAGILRLNPNGTPDLTFDPGWGTKVDQSGWNDVNCLALQSDNRLMVGGPFHEFNRISRNHIVRLTNDLGAPLQVPAAITIQAPSCVTTWPGANCLFGVSAAGTPPISFQWLKNGAIVPGQTNGSCWFPSASFADSGGYTLVVSNRFGSVTSAPVWLTVLPYSARPGALDTNLVTGSGPDRPVWSIAEQPDGKLLVGGNFTAFNGAARGGVVRLEPNGRVDTNFTAIGVGGDREVYTVLPQTDRRIVVGGWFTNFNGEARTNIVRLEANGSIDRSFNADFDGWVWPMVQLPGGKLLVGGYFGEVNGELGHNNLVRLNTNGTVDATFDIGIGADNNTSALTLQPDGKILVGGVYSNFNGVFRGGIARLNTNGTLDTSFNPGTAIQDSYGGVDAIALQPDGKILIGGAFSAFDGVPRPNLARLNADGTLDTTFVPAALPWLAESWVYGLELQPDGKVIVGACPPGGWGTGAAACVARLNPDGSLDTSFALGACSLSGVWCSKRLSNGQIMVGGSFPDFNGAATPYLVRLRGDEALPPTPVALTARLNGGLRLEWPSALGTSYQLQSTTNLPGAVWRDEGTPFPGTGGRLSTNLPLGLAADKFFRLQIQN